MTDDANLLVELEARARAATNLAELCFSIANDSHSLLQFRQALVFSGSERDSRLHTVSGLTKLSEDSPYLLWLKRIWPSLQAHCNNAPAWLTQKALVNEPAELHDGWQEWWPEGVYALPVMRRDGEVLGWVCFLLEQQPTQAQHQAVVRVLQSWSYAWEMLAGKPRRGLRKRWQGMSKTKRRVLIIALGILPFIPVRQSYLAPAEVIAMDATAVAAPMEGVIMSLEVRPNQAVKTGDVLFLLDDTVLRNRQAVLRKSVAVADAELMANTQKAFDDARSKGEQTMLIGRAQERRAELASVQAQLERTVVRASHDGIAVFTDPDDWLGRPVSTGERIMQLANPETPGVLIEVPVADALVLHEGAAVKLFLTVKPLTPLRASVVQSSYQAYLSDERVASYRLRAAFTEQAQEARIGLRGTAKVYGNWTVLGYYLMRRPLASLRELTGW